MLYCFYRIQRIDCRGKETDSEIPACHRTLRRPMIDCHYSQKLILDIRGGEKMKRILALVLLPAMLWMSGCSLFTLFDPKDTPAGSTSADGTGLSSPVTDGMEGTSGEPQTEEPADVYTGRDHIFFDNSQTIFSFTSSGQFISVVHALMAAEALRDPACYTLQIEDGEVNKDFQKIGYLHWQSIDYNSLRTCFADKKLYTFAQTDESSGMLEIPKLEDKGPLALIFEDGKLDASNLSVIVTDMMENDFGATQVAAALTQLLTERSGLEAVLYGFQCDGFSGNLSFPNYTTEGSVVSTVEGYRGQAPMYLLAIGPINEVEEFDSRLRENLPDAVDLHRAVYINSVKYINSGVSAFQAVSSLDHKIQGGNYDTLNYTVNAFLQKVENGAFAFGFDDSYVAHGYGDQAQISLIASMDADSPFRTNRLDITGLTVEAVSSDGTVRPLDIDTVQITCTAADGLEAWKTKGKASEKLDAISQEAVLLVQIQIPKPDKKETIRVSFDLTAPLEKADWIEAFNASVYEYNSLSDLLPQAANDPNHLLWTAGATDILTRTAGLSEFDTLLRQAVPEAATVQHVAVALNR